MSLLATVICALALLSGCFFSASFQSPGGDDRARDSEHRQAASRRPCCKKVMSGDPVGARLLCAILTEMVTFVGWKLFEMNATMKFHGITKATFLSIMRRSLVILCKERFVCAARLARLPPGSQGLFLMQEDMKDFVTSKPAAGALFTILMGDLSQFSVDRFREKKESYADGGGDGGLPRATMRSACGLKQELHAPGSTGGPVHAPGTPGLDIGTTDQEVESVGSRRILVALPWFRADTGPQRCCSYHVSLLTHCLNDGLDLWLSGTSCQQATAGPARCICNS